MRSCRVTPHSTAGATQQFLLTSEMHCNLATPWTTTRPSPSSPGRLRPRPLRTTLKQAVVLRRPFCVLCRARLTTSGRGSGLDVKPANGASYGAGSTANAGDSAFAFTAQSPESPATSGYVDIPTSAGGFGYGNFFVSFTVKNDSDRRAPVDSRGPAVCNHGQWWDIRMANSGRLFTELDGNPQFATNGTFDSTRYAVARPPSEPAGDPFRLESQPDPPPPRPTGTPPPVAPGRRDRLRPRPPPAIASLRGNSWIGTTPRTSR